MSKFLANQITNEELSSEASVSLTLTGRLIYPNGDRVLQFLREGWFEYRELTLLSRLVKPGDCFVDVGAHCGLYSRLAWRRMSGNGTIVVVEPNPALIPYIRANLSDANLIVDDTVKVGAVNLVNAAVAGTSGEATLYVSGEGWSAYSALVAAGRPNLQQTVPVRTHSLASLIVPVSNGQTFVKLDVEGLEFGILQGAATFLAGQNDISLLIEFDEHNLSFSGRTTAELIDLVRQLGYELAEFDTDSGRLIPYRKRAQLWGANLLATRCIDLLNRRLENLAADLIVETEEFLRKGEAAERIYRQSESLRTADVMLGQIGDLLADCVRLITGSFAELSGEPNGVTKVDETIAATAELPSLERLQGLASLAADQSGKLIGAAKWLGDRVEEERREKERFADACAEIDESREEILSQLARLKAENRDLLTDVHLINKHSRRRPPIGG